MHLIKIDVYHQCITSQNVGYTCWTKYNLLIRYVKCAVSYCHPIIRITSPARVVEQQGVLCLINKAMSSITDKWPRRLLGCIPHYRRITVSYKNNSNPSSSSRLVLLLYLLWMPHMYAQSETIHWSHSRESIKV